MISLLFPNDSGIDRTGHFVSGTFLLLFFFLLQPHPTSAEWQLRIRPRITVEETYTDNLFLSDNAKEEDAVTVVSPGLVAEAASRRHSLSFSYELGQSIYSRFSEYNDLRHSAAFSGSLGISRRTRMDFRNVFVLTEDPVENIENREEPEEEAIVNPQPRDLKKETVRHSRYCYYTHSTRLQFSHQFGEGESLKVGYFLQLLKNEDGTIRNEKSHSPYAELSFRPIRDRLGIVARMAYLRNDLEDARNNPGYLDEQLTPSLDATWRLIPKRLDLRAGLSYSKGVSNPPEPDEDNRFESISPYLGLTYRFPESQVTLDGDLKYQKAVSDTREGVTDPTDDFQTWEGVLSVTKRWDRRFEAFFRYASSSMDYYGDQGNNEDFTVIEPSFGFRYLVSNRLPISLRIGYLIRDLDSGKENAVTVNGAVEGWRFSRRGTLNFTAASGYDNDWFGAEGLGFGFYYHAELNIRYLFTKYLSGFVRGRYDRNRYLDNEDAGGDIRDDRSREFGAGLNYKTLEWWTAGIEYVYRNLDATEAEDSYEDNRVIFKIGLTPTRGFLLP